ncbi:MAG: M1 family aminopeptidase [Bacteroidia bacterium]|nr:M1 family aminopeptidase [Bacteroidia bacterium]
MLLKVLGFELRYRITRPATWIYFGIMFLLAFGAASTDYVTIGSSSGLIKLNAPTKIALMMAVLTALPGFFFASAVMGNPILRDFQHKTSALIFTTPISKGAYLFGRFAGSYLILLLIFSGMLVGFMLGPVMPWVDADKYLPYNVWHFIQPFLLFVIPNAFIAGSLFFMGGALSKKLLFVYVQGIALFVLYMVSGQFLSELERHQFVAWSDPIGLNLLNLVSRYWTVTEQNSQTYELAGLILQNRVLWTLIGIAALAITYFRFNFHARQKKVKKGKEVSKSPLSTTHVPTAIPKVAVSSGWQTNLQRVLSLSKFYFLEVIKSIPFQVIVGLGLFSLIMDSTDMGTMYGTNSYPTTYQVLGIIGNFNLFFIILIVFYTGELIWRERDVKINQIHDALPMPDFVGMVSKFLGFMALHVVMLMILMIAGIIIQATKGYFNFEIGVYLKTLFSDTLIFLTLFTLLTFFIHVIVNQKFLGHAIVVLVFLMTSFILPEMGIEHNLFLFGNFGLGTYSDMNDYGHYVTPFSWYSLYWLGFVFVLAALSVVLAVRGTDTLMKTRFQLAGFRFSRPILSFGLAALMMFGLSGCYIFYNTNVVNKYENSDIGEERQANYEKELKQYQNLAQPKNVETYMEVDIYPERRDFDAEGYFVLKNKHAHAISEIHIQHNINVDELSLAYLSFGEKAEEGHGQASIKEEFPDFGYYIYELTTPLDSGDSVVMYFKNEFRTNGFVESGSNTQVVFNGTFFNNTYFPSIGYNASGELTDKDDRKEYDLPEERERALPRTDSLGQITNFLGDDADHIKFEIKMSTSPDQIAIAPGYLQKEWEEEGRRYFHYKMDVPMFNFYSMISARYEVVREAWETPQGRPVNLEVYYHKGHEYNLDRMMGSMKHSISYYEEHFSPYQFRQMRIMEFPRYSTFAQSFANTVPYSEGIGFILKPDEDDVDMNYYVTAHEMAHQWWGHQVIPANVQGAAMVSETMSQYSALMVMKEKYPEEMMQKFLKHELDRYLSGRRFEQKKERPLDLVESQGYIHYRKGSLIMYALQDYIGEDKVNEALKRMVDTWAWREDRYATTDTLVQYLRDVTPDSLQYMITDFFETITLYENRAKTVNYTELDNGKYQVSLDLSAVKYRADSLGNETAIDFEDWIDIGVYTEGESGKDSLIYLQKHPIKGDVVLEVEVDVEPTKAGIDPINKLIDRNPSDNTTTATKGEAESTVAMN